MAGIKRNSQDDQYTPRGLQNSSKRSRTSLVEHKSSYTPTPIKQRPLHQRSAGFWDYVPGFVKDILCRSPDVTSCKLISPVAIPKLKWDRYAITEIRSSSLVKHGFTQFFSTTRRLKGRKCERETHDPAQTFLRVRQSRFITPGSTQCQRWVD